MWLFLMRYPDQHVTALLRLTDDSAAPAGIAGSPATILFIPAHLLRIRKYDSKVAGVAKAARSASVESRAYAVHEGRQQTRRDMCSLRWPVDSTAHHRACAPIVFAIEPDPRWKLAVQTCRSVGILKRRMILGSMADEQGEIERACFEGARPSLRASAI